MIKARTALAVAAASFIAAGAFAATSLPKGRPGQWIVAQHAANGQDYISKLCSNDATQADMMAIVSGVYRSLCTRLDVTSDGNKVQVDALCRSGQAVLTLKSVITYSGDSAFHVSNDSKYAPAFLGKAETRGTSDAHWDGGCSFGMAPGDMIGSTGLRARFSNAGTVAALR